MFRSPRHAPVYPRHALELDHMLQRLAVLPDALLLALAREAADFVRRSLWLEYGYLRLDDFARERLGVSGRWLRLMARLHPVLQKFPALVPAISGRDGGRPLGWVRALEIGRLATPETLADWIERARNHPSRARLDAPAEAAELPADASGSEAAAPADAGISAASISDASIPVASVPAASISDDVPAMDGCSDDSECDRVMVEDWLPPEVQVIFDEARVLHRAVAGRDSSLVEFIEAQVGEASAGGWAPDQRIRRLQPGRDRAASERELERTTDRWRELRRASAAVVPGPSSPALASALALHDRYLEIERAISAKHEIAPVPVVESNLDADIPAPSSKHPAPTPAHPVPCSDGAEPSSEDAEPDAFFLELVRMQAALEMRIGALLVEMEDGRAWAALGFDSLEHYAAARFGMSRTAARLRARLARRLAGLTVVREAYESGRIGMEAADWVRRWLPARDPATQELWVAHAAEVSVKRLREESVLLRREQLVARGEFGARCAEADRRLPPPSDESGRGGLDPDRRFQPPSEECGTRGSDPDRRFPPPSDASGRHGLDPNRPPGGVSTDPARPPVAAQARARRFHPRSYSVPDDDAWLRSIYLAPGSTQARVCELAHALLGRMAARSPVLEVPLRLTLPRPEAEALIGCVESARRERAEQALKELSPAEEARLRPSERIARLMVGRGEPVPRWVGWLAMLEEFVAVHDDPRGMPKRPTDRVCSRDGFRCSAPGCTCRRGLQVHHVQYRSHLGPLIASNEILLCTFHHLRGEHGGLAQVRGRAPLDLVWRLGRGRRSAWYRNERRLPGEPERLNAVPSYAGPVAEPARLSLVAASMG